MESTLKPALVAAAVALVGLLIQLYVAYKSHKRALELHKVKSSTDRQIQLDKDFRALEVDAEKLRIRCWSVFGTIWEIQKVGQDESLHDANAKLIDRLYDQSELFQESWGAVKHEVPADWQGYLDVMKHDARKDVSDVCKRYRVLLRNYKEIPDLSPSSREGNLAPIPYRLTSLLNRLDQFGTIIAALRRQMYLAEDCDHKWEKKYSERKRETGAIESTEFRQCVNCGRTLVLSQRTTSPTR